MGVPSVGVRPAGPAFPPFCCPLCKGPLSAEPATQPDTYRCTACARSYPVVLGIPDFRIFPDPYIGYADDYAKAQRLASEAAGRSFAQLVERYWEITPAVPRRLVGRYIRHVLGGLERGRSSLAAMSSAAATLALPGLPQCALLEVGCGTGGLLVAAAQRSDYIVGIDIAFRWLVIARKRVEEAVQEGELSGEQAARIQIVCACAEYLPYPDQSFDGVIAGDIIEHTAHQEQVLQQCRQTLRAGGVMFLATLNRFSLAPEPHVQVWGVGFLPRAWMGAYVRLVRGVDYNHIRLVSAFELQRMLRRADFARWRILLPQLSAAQMQSYSPAERRGIAIYHRLATIPGLRHLLYLCGPYFQAVAVAPESRAPGTS